MKELTGYDEEKCNQYIGCIHIISCKYVLLVILISLYTLILSLNHDSGAKISDPFFTTSSISYFLAILLCDFSFSSFHRFPYNLKTFFIKRNLLRTFFPCGGVFICVYYICLFLRLNELSILFSNFEFQFRFYSF